MIENTNAEKKYHKRDPRKWLEIILSRIDPNTQNRILSDIGKSVVDYINLKGNECKVLSKADYIIVGRAFTDLIIEKQPNFVLPKNICQELSLTREEKVDSIEREIFNKTAIHYLRTMSSSTYVINNKAINMTMGLYAKETLEEHNAFYKPTKEKLAEILESIADALTKLFPAPPPLPLQDNLTTFSGHLYYLSILVNAYNNIKLLPGEKRRPLELNSFCYSLAKKCEQLSQAIENTSDKDTREKYNDEAKTYIENGLSLFSQARADFRSICQKEKYITRKLQK